jgi:hypothetical protein
VNRWGTKPPAPSVSKGKLPEDTPWSESELTTLRELRNDEMSARLIAGKLNRTVKSVDAKIAELRAIRR